MIKSLILVLKNIKKYNISHKYEKEFTIKEFSKKYKISVKDSYLVLEIFILFGEVHKIYMPNNLYKYNYKFFKN